MSLRNMCGALQIWLTAMSALALPTGVPRTDASSLNLMCWAAKCGIKTAPGYTLARFGDLDGVMASEDICANTIIVELPRQKALHTKAVGGFVPAGVDRTLWEEGPWFARLALLLLSVSAGEDSWLSPYVDALPRSFETPLHWSDEELAELQVIPRLE